jgi:hypothetical protein
MNYDLTFFYAFYAFYAEGKVKIETSKYWMGLR